MDSATFLFLILVCSTITGLITEALKKLIPNVKSNNFLAAIVSVVVGVAASIAYVVYAGVVVNTAYVFTCIGLTIASWLCAMLGYDKVIQTISQLFKTK